MRNKTIHIIILLFAILFLLPVIFTVMHSFMGQPNLLSLENPMDIFPKNFSFTGYYNIFIESTWYLRGFWNSMLYALVITICNIFVSVPAAYAFHEVSFRGKKALYFFYLVLMLMPLQVTILPNYIGLRDMNLINTNWAIILPGIFTPFGVFLMCQYMSGMEKSIIEAARIETTSIFTILRFVIIPQVKVCIVAMFVYIFAENWNLVEQPNVYLKERSRMPLSVLLAMGQECDALSLFAGSVLFMIPVVILYFYFHESLEAGLENLKL